MSADGKFEKAHEKVGGRKKGSSNEIREILKGELYDRIPRLFEEMDKMKGSAFVSAWNETASYAIPKLSAVKLDDNGKAATMMELIRQTALFHREERDSK